MRLKRTSTRALSFATAPILVVPKNAQVQSGKGNGCCQVWNRSCAPVTSHRRGRGIRFLLRCCGSNVGFDLWMPRSNTRVQTDRAARGRARMLAESELRWYDSNYDKG